MCYALTSLGYEADAAGDGIEGVAFFRRGSYSPVVTDLAMPGMTGWDVAEAVRQNVGVVLITGVDGAHGHTRRSKQPGLDRV